jgi:hypothetical protein
MTLKPPKPGDVAAMVAAIDGSDLSQASAELSSEEVAVEPPVMAAADETLSPDSLPDDHQP